MQAKDFYEVGVKAYNGDKGAGRSFFELVAPLVVPIAAAYALLPSYVMAKLVIESGWMTDTWNATAERLTGKTFRKKAQDFNNIFGMNCFSDNQNYLDRLPLPAWTGYRTTFNDWGPHGYGSSFHVNWEPWKSYRTVEDAIGDWCANIRYQADAHGHHWNPSDIVAQLVATESYTPEGSTEGVRPGLHFQWQEKVMALREQYGLQKYDDEVKPKVENCKMTAANMDRHVKAAYEYAHAHCHYAPCGGIPPMSDGAADCGGIATRALWTMGYMTGPLSFDDIGNLCEKSGMKKSTDIEDVWKHHGVVLMQGDHLYGTPHTSHVFYSLGGKNVNSISKYDLGSDDRIKKHQQPYADVPVNEWPGRYHFMAFYYVDNRLRDDVPKFGVACESAGRVVLDAGIYAGPGTMWRRLGAVKQGERVTLRGTVRNDAGNIWMAVCYKNTEGFVPVKAVAADSFEPYAATVTGTDGTLAVRAGAGAGCFKVAEIKEGTKLRVDNAATAKDGGEWLHVMCGKARGFVSAKFVKKTEKGKG